MESNSGIRIILTAREYLYRVFQSLYGNKPSWEQLDVVTNQTTQDMFDLFVEEPMHPYAQAVERMKPLFENIRNHSEGYFEAMEDEYVRFFVGPSELVVPPWETVYKTKERLIFQAGTLRVRNAYRAQGFITTEYPRVADDHLAIELDFMAQLAARATSACGTGDEGTLISAIGASADFLDEHLLAWVPDFVSQAVQVQNPVFYSALSILLLEFLKADKGVIEEIREAVK